MGPFETGSAEERLEAVVRAQRHEALGLEAAAALENLHHGGLEVVVADAPGHATELLEGLDVSVQEHLLGFVAIGMAEGFARGRHAHDEELHLGEHIVQVDADRPEVDLGFGSELVVLGNGHLDPVERQTLLGHPHVVAHGGLGHRGIVFLHQALPHPSGGVALLARGGSVGHQPGVDETVVRPEDRGAALGALRAAAAPPTRAPGGRSAGACGNAEPAHGSTAPRAHAPF